MSQAVAARVPRFWRALYILLALAVIVTDQVTKAIVERLIPLHSVISVIPHFLNLTHTRNPGVAFGLLADSPTPWKTAVLILISVALLAVVVYATWRSQELARCSGVGLALIVGGAVSNLADRIRTGHVVDFLDAYFRTHHWWSFNVADSAIVVGAIFLAIFTLSSD